MLTDIERAKIELMTFGMKVDGSARKAIEGDEKRPLTLADYASTSGISMVLEQDIWVNVPIADHNPNFVDETPFTLGFSDGRFFVRTPRKDFEVKPIPVPAYHNGNAESGELYTNLAITHTDRVRISPIGGCAITCTFCDLPYEFTYRKKDVNDLVESVGVALTDSVQPARHVLISGGTPRKSDYGYQNEVYGAVARAFPQTDVDIMMVPMPELLDPSRLHSQGIYGLSINLELWNERLRREYMKGKGSLNREVYLDFIENASSIFGEGNVRSLLMVGIEPMEDTLRGVEALAQRRCDPVLSPFRPDPATPLRDRSPPSVEFLTETYERAREIVGRYGGVKLGPRCIPCMHNTLTFPDDSGKYYSS
jgi:hypothetical protein